MIPSLETEIIGIKMKTPVMTGSGTFGFGPEYADYVDLEKVGAIVVKGTTLHARAGNKGQRIAETPAGMLNSIGLENPGVDYFVEKTLPIILKYNVPIIVNISGTSIEEFGILAEKLEGSGVAALEINISCPNVSDGGMIFGVNCMQSAAIVRAVKSKTKIPVITKLSPNVTSIVDIAMAVADVGSDAVSLINTLLGMAIDINTCRPMLGNVMGGLSGPAVKPVAVRMVYQVAKAIKIPVIGMGGIMTGADAVEFMLAGASAVAVGTANFVNPCATVTVAEEIRAYLAKKNIASVKDIVGKVVVG